MVGTKPTDNTPLGPIINALRVVRDKLPDKEDLLHLIIASLTHINNVFRKPIAHPDLVLTPEQAMMVFDSAKPAIELMLEDARKKASSPLPPGFF